MKPLVTGDDLLVAALFDTVTAAHNGNLDIPSECVAMECDRHIIASCNLLSTWGWRNLQPFVDKAYILQVSAQRGKNFIGRVVPVLSLVIAEVVAQEVPRVTHCCNELGQPEHNGFICPSLHLLVLD